MGTGKASRWWRPTLFWPRSRRSSSSAGCCCRECDRSSARATSSSTACCSRSTTCTSRGACRRPLSTAPSSRLTRRDLRLAGDAGKATGRVVVPGPVRLPGRVQHVLGEESLFRGVLLPRMKGVFGRWSWVANGVLFGLYHVHQPWGIPNGTLTGLLYSFPAYRYRSTWMSIILHSAQSVYFAFLVLGVVL